MNIATSRPKRTALLALMVGIFLPAVGVPAATPPSSENVNGLVVKTAIEVSDQQVSHLAQLTGENPHPIQQVHWRTLIGPL